VLATALTRGDNPSIPKKEILPAFRNVIVNGIVLAEDGKKMSKRLKNYPDPLEVLEKYGADAMRFYLVNSPVMHAESLNFSEKGVWEMYNKLINTLWNVYTFYSMFNTDSTDYTKDSTGSNNILDKWILAKLNVLVREVTGKMDEYKLAEASRPIVDFVTELSQWYVRRSRDRFKGDDEEDKQNALSTLRFVLLTLSKVMAPFTPFIAEKVYQEITKTQESVHLELWPSVDKNLADKKLLEEMDKVRKVVEMGLGLRAEAGIKVRQPLSQFSILNEKLRGNLVALRNSQFSNELKNIISEELNVKEVVDGAQIGNDWIEKEDNGIKVALNIKVTEDLRKEGLVREIVRTINQMRKEQKMTIHDRVIVEYYTPDELLKSVFAEFKDDIKRQVLASDICEEKIELDESDQTLENIDGRAVSLSVHK